MVALIVQDLGGQKGQGEWPMFFYQCDVALVSRATSPALCTIGAIGTFDEIVNGRRIAVASGQQQSTGSRSVAGTNPAQEPARKAAKAMRSESAANVMFAASGPYYSIVILGAARARPFSSVAFTFAAMAR
jgi:hypothetical protein